MRRFAWLLVIAILGIVLAVGNSYLRKKLDNARNAPAKPAPLAMGLILKYMRTLIPKSIRPPVRASGEKRTL